MIRHATPDDALAIATLYHDTVRKINSRDYGSAQIQAWAGATPDKEKWRERQNSRTIFVEEENGIIRCFAELEDDGRVGAVYVHADYQSEGIASALWTNWRRRLSRAVPLVFRLKRVSRHNLSSQNAGSKPSRRRT